MENNQYTLPDLPYPYESLEPYIDEATMRLHHQKHHAAYVKNLNEAIEKHPNLFLKAPEELISDLNSIPEDIRMTVRNNGGGHVNHSMFWQIMSPEAEREPVGQIIEAINSRFGGLEDFKIKFEEAGLKRFGSGWVWLVINKEGELEIMSTANQDNPMSEGYRVVFGNDVWEHAYYLKYKNVRADYLKAFWNVISWSEIEKRFSSN